VGEGRKLMDEIIQGHVITEKIILIEGIEFR
jgi:hypothetical protein